MIKQIKQLLRPTYHKLRWLSQRLRNITPSLPVSAHNYKLRTLGTDYGGWTFSDSAELNKSLIVSCGLGEDASFDVEFASHYRARIIIVDPTPRAIKHFDEIISRLGEKNNQPYTTTGAQPVGAYDLRNIEPKQLELCDKALWNRNTQVQFFAPTNSSHVSHSIVNFQNNYATNTDHIFVDAITIDKLFEKYNIKKLKILKLDIEGAEIEVLRDMISKAIYPEQVLVEYDELSVPSKTSKQRIDSTHSALTSAGYVLIHREYANFTYIHQSS